MGGKDGHETVAVDKCIAENGNWTDITKAKLGLDAGSPLYYSNFRPGTSVDALPGCEGCERVIGHGVSYEAKYRCGGSNKVKIATDINNGGAKFTCNQENNRCTSGELRVYDDGRIGFARKVKGSDELQETLTAKPYKNGLESSQHSSKESNYPGEGGKGTHVYDNGKEYTSFKIGDKLEIDEFIGSPNGSFFIKLQRNDAGIVALVGGRMESSCKTTSDGKQTYFADKPGCVAPYKMAAGSVKTDKSNQLAYVSTFDQLRWFDANPVDLSDAYYSAGHYTMSKDARKKGEFDNISADECRTKCNDLEDCHGYVYSETPRTCNLYDEANMFPNNLERLGPVADANMYVRLKKISNSGTNCSTNLVGISQDMIRGLREGTGMNENSKCRISEFTDTEQLALDKATANMDRHADVMAEQAVNIVRDNESLEKATYGTVSKQHDAELDMAQLQRRRRESDRNHATVLGMNESAALDMLSSNYQTLMLATVGIGVAAACMHFARQL
tara:strand:+ start:5128 stop:6633 length:1506 start_codon:yes stop_codon:yes gene_type:complete